MPRQIGHQFPDDIFKCTVLNENQWIYWSMIPRVQINNIPALVEILAWRRPGAKLLTEPMLVSLLSHICIPQCDCTDWNACFPQNSASSAVCIIPCFSLNQTGISTIQVFLAYLWVLSPPPPPPPISAWPYTSHHGMDFLWRNGEILGKLSGAVSKNIVVILSYTYVKRSWMYLVILTTNNGNFPRFL